jgi:hypothetical protein
VPIFVEVHQAEHGRFEAQVAEQEPSVSSALPAAPELPKKSPTLRPVGKTKHRLFTRHSPTKASGSKGTVRLKFADARTRRK